ncbi:MAG: DUF6020 family protein [Muribaculaceae bacterium]|nr:DUF6020 family protein [Muribaculaceae bacterium]
MSDKALLLILWLIVSLFQIPAWLSWFPGIFGYDTPIQFAMYTGDIPLNSANPLVHTWILGGIFSLGKAVFGSYQAGFVLFVILQQMLITNCMANMAIFLIRRRVPLIAVLIGLLWTITHPIIQILDLNTTKDILGGVFFAFFVMAFWKIIEEKKERKITEYIKAFFFGLMTCLLRNAILFLMIALLALSLFARLKDKKIYMTLLSVVVCVETFSLLCSSAFQIPKGDMRENLSIPIQQTAYIAYRYQTDGDLNLLEEDLRSLEELFADIEDFPANYDLYSADYPKGCFQTEAFKSDPGRYISLYFRLGMQYPKLYLEAVRHMLLPYWHMEANKYRGLSYTYTFPDLNHWDIHPQYPAKLVRYRMYMVKEIEAPFYPFWRQPGLCIWLLAALSGAMIARKEKNGFLKLLPMALYFIGVLMGPVALLRYLYPVMLTTPILFGMLFQGSDESAALMQEKCHGNQSDEPPQILCG